MKIFKLVLKVIGGIIALAIVAGIVYALIHLNAIMLIFGKGKLKLNDVSQMEKSLKSSSVYTIAGSSGSGSEKTLDVVSKDQAVAMKVTQNGSGETITGTVDQSKLPDVDISDLSAVKKMAESYLSPFLTEDQIVGLGGYAAKEAMTQGQNANGISISQTYSGAKVDVSTDKSGAISFKIETDDSSK
jgi:hypothetical protein